MTDLFGEKILLGSLVAFTKGNQLDLEIGIVIRMDKYNINYPIKCTKHVYKYEPKRNGKRRFGKKIKTQRTVIGSKEGIRSSWISINEDTELQGRFVVIKNPLFHLNNPAIIAQLEIMDMAKDKGLLPEDYKLGVPFGK